MTDDTHTVTITADEYYPVFDLTLAIRSAYGEVVDIPADLLERYAAARDEWQAVQRVLGELYYESED